MKVNFLGNVCNNHYAIAKALRKVGIDVRLFLFDNADFNVRPESDDASLEGSYPSWIVKGRYKVWQAPPREKLQEMMDADLIVSHADTALHFPDSVYKRLIVFPYGTDIFVFPFKTIYYKNLFPNPIYNIFSIKKKIRRVFALSRKIILCAYDFYWQEAYRELLYPDTIIYPLGLIIDTETFRPPETTRKPSWPLQIFQSCRQLWTTDVQSIDGSKGNDIFFRGLAEAARQRPGAFEVTLVDSKTREDEHSKRLLRELDLDGLVRWVPRMARADLIAYYQQCDLVVDGLVHGLYGYSPVEALACGAPVLMYVVPHYYERSYGEDPPVVNARTPEEVAAHLTYFADHPDELLRVGQDSRAYVLRQHSEEVMVPRYREVFESVVDATKKVRTLAPEFFKQGPNGHS